VENVYPVALVAASANPDAAFFLAYLTSQAATKIFLQYGFEVLSKGSSLHVGNRCPSLNFSNGWKADTRSRRLNDASAPGADNRSALQNRLLLVNMRLYSCTPL